MVEWPKHKARNVKIVDMLREGESLSYIAKSLEINKSTVSYYAKKIGVRHSVRVKNRMRQNALRSVHRNAVKARERRESSQQRGRDEATGEQIHVMGCMLHWAEGSKYSRNKTGFCNTDPDMLKLYIKFLKYLGVSRGKIKWHCRTHKEGVSLEKSESYWARFLGLKKENKNKGSVETRPKRKNKSYNQGICYLVVNDVEVTQRIYGSIGKYAGIDTSCWL